MPRGCATQSIEWLLEGSLGLAANFSCGLQRLVGQFMHCGEMEGTVVIESSDLFYLVLLCSKMMDRLARVPAAILHTKRQWLIAIPSSSLHFCG